MRPDPKVRTRTSRAPVPRARPSWAALLSIAAYWGVWLLLVVSLVTGRHRGGSSLGTVGWMLGATALAAWLTWVRLKDDERKRQLGEYGPDDDDPDELASPASRLLQAVLLGLGGLGCLGVSALVPAMRGELVILGILALVGAFHVLFFGRRGSHID